MITDCDELELKFDASKISIEDFKEFCYGLNPDSSKTVSGPDSYWTIGDAIWRHRADSRELTQKRRKSGVSSQDRLEMDLIYDSSMSPQFIDNFLALSGFKLEFALTKTAYISYVYKSGHKFSIVVYDVNKVGENGKLVEPRRFIEIEIDKKAAVTADRAKVLLREWKQELQKAFKELGEPLNESLWEIYSGKLYPTIEKEKTSE
jgi:hypothetical protein